MTAQDQAAVTPAAFVLPKGACDTHCHVFGPYDRFPLAASRAYEQASSPKETLQELHQRLGVARAVIVQASAYGTDNRALLDALRSNPDHLRGVAMIDDATPAAELETLADAGVKGIRFNFVESLGAYPDPDVFRRAVDRAAAFGWHVVLHVKGPDLLALRDVITALKIPFIIDHMGRVDAAQGVDQPAFQALLGLLGRDNAWVKVSGAERMSPEPFHQALPFARALVAARPDRVLWGTDFPHPNLPVTVEEERLVDFIAAYTADEAQRHQLLVANPAKLYGFKGA